MKNSGKRQTFATGAVRDSDETKPRIDLISPFFLERVGERMRTGAKTYGERNYELGIPISRSLASLYRHLVKYHAGERDEDHLAGAVCNLVFMIHVEEMVRRGVLPPSLLDLPKYRRHSSYHEEKAKIVPDSGVPTIRFHDDVLARWDDDGGAQPKKLE